MSRRWILLDQPESEVLKPLEASVLIRQLLWQRGVQAVDQAQAWLAPSYNQLHDPFLYRGMDRAVDRLLKAIQAKERITVYGDYDADGICATAIMVETLSQFQAEVDWYVPERLAEGYGLNATAIEELAKQGTKVLVTVDCGTSNIQEVAHAKTLGLDVIVLDHHQAGPTLPDTFATINPFLPHQTYPFTGHSSGGVAFSMASALIQAGRKIPALESRIPAGWEKWLLDLVAISTVADMMVLQGENRTLVHFGLQVLRKNRRPGLRALFTLMGTAVEAAKETTIGYQIAPRLNAAGRLQHASTALRLLIAKDPSEATALAQELHTVNAQRQRLTELAVTEALDQLEQQGEQSGYVAYAPHWSPGIVGLIAGRLVERVWRPVLVMTDNGELVVGSGRSIPGFDITAHLRQGQDHFLRFGGHAGACGFTLATRDGRADFVAWFQTSLRDVIHGELEPKPLTIDLTAQLSDFTAATVDDSEKLSPYGIGNERPKFLLEGLKVSEASPVGANGQHLRFIASQGEKSGKFIAFGAADQLELLRAGDIDAVVEASWNEWNGQREVQLKVVDLRASPV